MDWIRDACNFILIVPNYETVPEINRLCMCVFECWAYPNRFCSGVCNNKKMDSGYTPRTTKNVQRRSKKRNEIDALNLNVSAHEMCVPMILNGPNSVQIKIDDSIVRSRIVLTPTRKWRYISFVFNTNQKAAMKPKCIDVKQSKMNGITLNLIPKWMKQIK